ncbi:acyl-CoA dehydrogenase C-terminal domain-containing protein, partial [Stenotrophomonas maltophilia]|nr:acyl-CoA dehydrogenase C-terminal domain-containing protein [Stenotrophomonas maltophilia]MCI1109416.1 acyl-CoA dehydrogenase C-terminal domain-containing protein [Stenotrophomonas maltophilia]
HGAAFAQSKRETARFYFARVLPRTLSHAAAIQAGAAPLMATDDERFGA